MNANYNGLTQPSNMTCDQRLRDDLGDDWCSRSSSWSLQNPTMPYTARIRDGGTLRTLRYVTSVDSTLCYKGSVIAILAPPALLIQYLVWLNPPEDILNTLQRDSESATTVPTWPDSRTFTTLNTGKEWLKHRRPGGSIKAPSHLVSI